MEAIYEILKVVVYGFMVVGGIIMVGFTYAMYLEMIDPKFPGGPP